MASFDLFDMIAGLFRKDSPKKDSRKLTQRAVLSEDWKRARARKNRRRKR